MNMGLTHVTGPQAIGADDRGELPGITQHEHRNGASAGSMERVDRGALRRDIQNHLASIGLSGHRADGVLEKDTIEPVSKVGVSGRV